MDVCIKVGDQYVAELMPGLLSPASVWSSQETWITVRIGDELGGNSGAGRIICNRYWGSPGPNYSGHGFEFGSSVGVAVGVIEVRIRNVVVTGQTGKTVYFGNLALKWHADSREAAPVSCTATNGTDYRATESRDAIFSTAVGRGNRAGLLNADGTEATGLEYRGTQKRPEQWLADRIAQYGNGVREVLRYVIDASQVGADLTPAVKLNADSITRWAMSVSHRWWNDEATVVMTEV
jgi:hypothetical protein